MEVFLSQYGFELSVAVGVLEAAGIMPASQVPRASTPADQSEGDMDPDEERAQKAEILAIEV